MIELYICAPLSSEIVIIMDRLSDQTGVAAVFRRTSLCAVTVGCSGVFSTAVCVMVLCVLFLFTVRLFDSMVCTCAVSFHTVGFEIQINIQLLFDLQIS